MGRGRILVVDDEKNILTTLSRTLGLEGYEVEVAGGGKIGLEKFSRVLPDVVLLDVKMPDIDGLDVLEQLRDSDGEIPVVMMSGHGTIDTAVRATKLGAFDFIEKPLSMDRVLLAVGNALQMRRLGEENARLRETSGAATEIIGDTSVMVELRKKIEMAAPTNGRVLIFGESGTGKELIANAIHRQSQRQDEPFVKFNCAAVPAELIESELFGHVKGSFTGAVRDKRGKFEQADGGTLFLDEVGDMAAAMQAKLLRVLQEGELERVGGDEIIKVDVRVIAATNKDLESEIEKGRFREDLFYRLNVVPIQAPPLRARREDIPALVDHFLRLACADNAVKPKKMTDEAVELLCEHPWPGNVRELKNSVERLVILTPGEIGASEVRSLLRTSSSPSAGRSRGGGFGPLKEQISAAERDIILTALDRNKWNVSNTARELELERSHLYKKMRALGIEREKS